MRWPAFARELEAATGAAIGYRATGTLSVAVDRDEAELLHRMHGLQRELGLDAEWLTGSECRRLEPGLAPRVAGGILAPADHQVAPRALIGALASAFTAAGGELRRGVRMLGLETGPEGVEAVVVEGGDRISARAVVLAAGAESGRLDVPQAARVPVRPVKGQILRLRARAGAPLPAARVIRTPEVYAVPREDGRLVVGATVEERGFDVSVTAGGVLELLRRGYEALPGIAELELAETAGRPASRCPGQRADRGRERGEWARVGHGSLAQRDPARADHRGGRRGTPRRRRAAPGVRSLFAAALRRSRRRGGTIEDHRQRR